MKNYSIRRSTGFVSLAGWHWHISKVAIKMNMQWTSASKINALWFCYGWQVLICYSQWSCSLHFHRAIFLHFSSCVSFGLFLRLCSSLPPVDRPRLVRLLVPLKLSAFPRTSATLLCIVWDVLSHFIPIKVFLLNRILIARNDTKYKKASQSPVRLYHLSALISPIRSAMNYSLYFAFIVSFQANLTEPFGVSLSLSPSLSLILFCLPLQFSQWRFIAIHNVLAVLCASSY